MGSVEILKGKQTVAFGGSLHLVLLPPPLQASQNIAIALRRLMKSSEKEGVRGMLPLDCLPLWGESGSPSQLPHRISELQEKEDFNTAGKTKKNPVDHGEVSQQRSTGNTTRYSHVTTAFLKRHHASTNMSEVNTTRPRYDMRMSAGVYW